MADPESSYIDFDLQITLEDGKYFAKVLDSPSGPSQRVALRTPFFPNTTMRELMLTLEVAVLRSQGRYRTGPVSRDEGVLRDFGSEMFKIVLREPPEIAAAFASSLMLARAQRGRNSDGLRLKLRVDPPELACLPWEYVYDEISKEYLCLLPHSPLVRFLEVGAPPAGVPVEGPLNILGMIANPGGSLTDLDVANERQNIDAAIAALQRTNDVYFRWVPGDTRDHLMDMMEQRPWHVFHFIGHGASSPAATGAADAEDGTDDQSDGYVIFGDGQGGSRAVSARELKLLLQGGGSLQLAVLNCCESGRGSARRAFSSPGAALVRSGVPAVVAMQFPISDQAAIEFSRRFYASLAAGLSIERALTNARVAMWDERNFEWGIPVLFTRTRAGTPFPSRERAPRPADDGQGPAVPPVAVANADYAAKRQTAQQELRRLFAGSVA
jgi:hypothetical protein